MDFIANMFGYLLNFIYNIVNNYGLAIILFTIIIKLILLPISIKQQKSMKKSAKIQAEMKDIQKKYKNNPEKLNQETMELYKREKMSPFSGCLSSILQLVLLLAIFYLVRSPLTFMKKIDTNIINDYTTQIQEENSGNKSAYPEIDIIQKKGGEDNRVYINMDFLGIDLSKVPTQSLNDFRVYIIPILYVISSFLSIKITTSMQTNKKKSKELIINENGQPEEEIDTMAQMNKTMSFMMPIMSISIAIVAPLGLALYWLISNLLMIAERLILNKFMESKEEKENV